MPLSLRLRQNRNGSSGRPSAQRVAQGASRIRDRLATRRSLVTTSPRNHHGPAHPPAVARSRRYAPGPDPSPPSPQGSLTTNALRASCPVASFPLGTLHRVPSIALRPPTAARLRRVVLLGETVVAPRSLNDATIRTTKYLVAVVPVSRLRDATPTGFASGRFAHSANKPPPVPPGSRSAASASGGTSNSLWSLVIVVARDYGTPGESTGLRARSLWIIADDGRFRSPSSPRRLRAAATSALLALRHRHGFVRSRLACRFLVTLARVSAVTRTQYAKRNQLSLTYPGG